MNDILSICIPTYNRGAILKDNLETLIANFGHMEIPIIISDNASEDNTEEIVREIQSRYPYLTYSKNDQNLGVDRNFEKALKLSETKYAWLLGDDDTIKVDISPILEKLAQTKPDLLFLGEREAVGEVKEGLYDNREWVFYELANRGLSWMSACIFSKDIIQEDQFKRYYDTEFTHVGILLDYLGLHGLNVYYMENNYVEMLRPSFIAYNAKLMKIYARGWSNLMFRLPGFTYEEKLKNLRHRTEVSGMLSNKVLLSAHSQGNFSYKDLKENYEYIKLYNKSPYFVLATISVFPKKVGLLMRSAYKRVKRI